MEFQRVRDGDGAVSWRSGGVEVLLLPACGYSTREPVERASLGFSFARQRGVHSISSDKLVDFDRLPGSYALAPSGVDMFSESDAGGEYMVIRYEDSVIGSRMQNPFDITRGANIELWKIVRTLRSRLLSNDADEEAMSDLCLSVISAAALPAVPHSERREDEDAVRRGLGIIDCSIFDEGFRVSLVAQALGMAPVSFLRAFRRLTGITPSAFVTERRLQRAREMMRANRAASLSETAAACGFSHQSHMGQAFRHVLGITPGEYRKQFR